METCGGTGWSKELRKEPGGGLDIVAEVGAPPALGVEPDEAKEDGSKFETEIGAGDGIIGGAVAKVGAEG